MSSAKPPRLSCSEPLGHKPNSVCDSPHCSSGLIYPHYLKNVVQLLYERHSEIFWTQIIWSNFISFRINTTRLVLAPGVIINADR